MSDYSASPEFRKALGPAYGASNLARRDTYSAGPYVDGFNASAAPAAGSFTLAQYWSILTRRKGTVLLIALLGAGAAFLLTRMQTPVYRARTLLEIESLNEDFLNMRNVNPTAGRDPFQSPEYMIRTQTMVLQSRPVMERTLGKMDIEKRLLSSRKTASTLPWLAPKAAKPETLPPREQALAVAAAGFKVRAEPNTRVLEATFDSSDPRLAADFVNSIAGAFAEQNRENRWQSSQNISKWLTQQLADVKAKLETDEDALQRYANASSLTFLSDKNTAAEERLRQLQLDLLKAQGDRVAKQSAYELAKAAPAESLPEVLDDATLKEYQVQLTTLRRQLAEMSSTFGPENPKIINVQAQITTLEGALQNKRTNILSRIHNDFEATSRREQLLNTAYASQVAVMGQQSTKVAHYSVLQREADTTRQLYDSMLQRVREAALAAAMQASEIQVVESANTPRIPYKPDLILNTAFGLFSGLIGGVAFVLMRARSNRGYQAPGELAIELNVPELGVIPAGAAVFTGVRRLLGSPGSSSFASGGRERLELTTWQRWPSAIAESFRLTLTSILLAEKNGGARPRAIVVSSALPGEGKTTVISNLAIALARVNRRVLLIDGDLRKPRIHDVFEVENSRGFRDVLGGDPALPIHETKIPNLFVMPSGRGVDEKLFFTAPLRQVLQRLKSEFDMILIDTPPLLQMSDTRLISHHADAVILVVAQHTARDAVALASQRLGEDGSVLLGTILNNWDPKTSHQGPKEYGDYFKQYQQSEAL